MQWEEGANSQHWLPHLRHSTYLSACAALGLCLTWVSLNIPTPILLIRKQRSRKQWLAESKVQCDIADDFVLSSKYGEKESEREKKQLNIFGNIQKLTLTFFCNQILVLQSIFFSIWINFLVMVHRFFVVPHPSPLHIQQIIVENLLHVIMRGSEEVAVGADGDQSLMR